MKTLYLAIAIAVGFTTISCEKKDRKVIKVNPNETVDKTKDALKDAGDFLEKKSKQAVDAVKEKTK